MSGYRQSGYDPEAYQTTGRPLRPFNLVQWTGVAFEIAGLLLFLESVAVKLGWIPRVLGVPSIVAIMLMIIGVSLINSRRQPDRDVTPEQRAANRRLLIITIAICAIIIGLAAAIEYTGA